MNEAVMKSEAFAGWAIVELMGHRIRAGEVKEVEMGTGLQLLITFQISWRHVHGALQTRNHATP